MNENIDQMITHDIVAVDVVVEGKRDIGHRTIGGTAFDDDMGQVDQAEMCQPNVRVIPDIGHVIENKGAGQGIDVDEYNDQCRRQKNQCFMGEAGGGRMAFGTYAYFEFFADKDSPFLHAGCVKIEMLSIFNAGRRMVEKETEAIPVKISKMGLIVNARVFCRCQNI